MSAIQPDRTFTVQDPRNFDGDAYQVAERAIQQLAGIVALAREQMEPVTLMVRNADLDRTLALGEPLGNAATEWPKSPQGRKLAKIREELEGIGHDLTLLQRVAAWDPTKEDE